MSDLIPNGQVGGEASNWLLKQVAPVMAGVQRRPKYQMANDITMGCLSFPKRKGLSNCEETRAWLLVYCLVYVKMRILMTLIKFNLKS